MIQLRTYQQEAVDQARAAIAAGNRRPLIVAATGAGKTIIYCEIIRLAIAKGATCLFLVHRRNLVTQFRKTLEEDFFIGAGCIMAGEEFEAGHKVYVSTIQTYARRIQLEEQEHNKFFIDADIVLTDESHRTLSKQYEDVLQCYNDKVIIGTTATPIRGDGRGLGNVYNALLDIAGTARLTDEGFLSTVRYFVPTEIDLSHIKIRLGDYEKKALAGAVDKPKIIGDIVENWLKIAGGRKTIVFAVNVKHSKHIAEEFNRHGIPAMHLDAKSPDEERDAAFMLMSNDELTVICNVGLYSEGMDVPSISCVVMARPTKSLGLYRQCLGRGLRLSDKFDDCIVIDHGGCVEEHGMVTEEIEWSLDDKKLAWKKKQKPKKKKPVKCKSCFEVFEGASKCPVCGTEVQSFGRDVATLDGELKELTPAKKNKTIDFVEKRLIMGAFNWHAKQNGYKPGWAKHSYKSYFGVWPNDKRVSDVGAIKPQGNAANILKHVLIKKAKEYKKSLDK